MSSGGATRWIVAWAFAVAGGFGALGEFSSSPGVPAEAPGVWPGGLPQPVERYAMVVLAHPQCPCTRATLHELDRIVAAVADRVEVSVLFLRPAGRTEAWAESELWQIAAGIPGVVPRADPEGALAARFGAHTSGQVVLYDPQARLVFSGGITAARGHEGDNLGADAIIARVLGQRDAPPASAVFGCSLESPDRGARPLAVGVIPGPPG